MTLQANAIVIGVKDIATAKKFYGEGMGCKVEKDYPQFVTLRLGDGGPELGLYTTEALANDAGVPAEGHGFRAVSFHNIVATQKHVDEVMARAERAGGKIVRPAEKSKWGGYFGWFADPDGHLWKVVASAEV